MIASDGTAYPIAVKDGLLYTAGGHMVETDCISQETHALMVQALWDEYTSAEIVNFTVVQ